MLRIDKHTYFLKIAELVALRSTCPRRAVGCVIVNGYGHILATGYNGVPKNYPHCIDTPCGGENFDSSTALNKCMATHAEQNALLQCSSIMTIDIIYCTTSPCITCAKLIANTSCKTVIYSNIYKDNSGIKMLNKLNINTIHYKI
jgi:dCMP deaminase